MIVAAGTIIAVWTGLLGAAYGARRAGARTAILVVTAVYLAFAAAALAWLGLNHYGSLGCLGMLLPYAAAIGLIVATPKAGAPAQRGRAI